MEREARRHTAGRRSPGCFEIALHFHGCHQATTSIGRDKFDLQILNARLREIDDAQNTLVVQAVVGGQEQHALFRGPAAQDLRHARGQFGRRNLLIGQGHLTVRREPSPAGGPRMGQAAGPMLRISCDSAACADASAEASRDVDVVALHEQGNDDHEDDQQHEHHVDERRDVDLGLQTGAGIVCVELHDVISFCAGALGDQSHAAEAGLLDRGHGLPDLAEVELCVAPDHDLGVLLGAHRSAEGFAEMLGCDRLIVDPQPAGLVDGDQDPASLVTLARSVSSCSAG